VYFLADDFASEWAIALLNSLDTYAPTCSIWCIPFSEEITVLKRLASKFRFRIYGERSLLELDSIGRSLFPKHYSGRMAGTFRKFAAFWGPLKHFVYFDADIVILDDVQPLFTTLLTADYDLLYAHSDLNKAYKPGPFRERMVREYQTHGFNTGAWASTRGQLNLAEIRAFSVEVAPNVDSFTPHLEQPFFNYCLDRKRTRMQSFASASEHRIYWNWPGWPERLHVSAPDKSPIQVYTDRCQFVSGMHWAGYSLDPRMPHYHIYRHFRLLSSTRFERLKWHVRKWVRTFRRRLHLRRTVGKLLIPFRRLGHNLRNWSV
jgi:hypothetical protein